MPTVLWWWYPRSWGWRCSSRKWQNSRTPITLVWYKPRTWLKPWMPWPPQWGVWCSNRTKLGVFPLVFRCCSPMIPWGWRPSATPPSLWRSHYRDQNNPPHGRQWDLLSQSFPHQFQLDHQYIPHSDPVAMDVPSLKVRKNYPHALNDPQNFCGTIP